jgi:ubiquitin C-terminal hydrolase
LDDGSKHDAIKSTSFLKLPPVLLVQLKRFSYNQASLVKINKKIEFHRFLNLNNYMTTTKEETKTGDSNDNLYELYAVIVHEGDTSYGHYYAYIKNPKQGTTNPFIKFNDFNVTYSSDQEVLNNNFEEFSADIDQAGNIYQMRKESERTPYILVYTEVKRNKEIFEEYNIGQV